MGLIIQYSAWALLLVSEFVVLRSLFGLLSRRAVLEWAAGSVGLVGASAILNGRPLAGTFQSAPEPWTGELLSIALLPHHWS